MEATNPPQTTVASADLGALERPSYFRRLGWFDWLFAVLLAAGAGFAFSRYGAYMDGYERGILIAAVPAFAWLGWTWKPVRVLMIGIAVLSLFGISQYGGANGPELARAEHAFFLKYFLASQSAILWMSALIFLSTLFFWAGLALRWEAGGSIGSKLCWAAVVLGLTGMLVRWYESYLVGADIGHIPISNLYEVFILFTLITSLFYLYYEQRYKTRSLGPFVMLVVSAAWNWVTDRTAVSIGRLLRVMMPCSAETTCAPTNTGSLPLCGNAACAPLPLIVMRNSLLDAISAPTRVPNAPTGTPGQLCRPNTASHGKRSNRPSLIISRAPPPPSSAGWKIRCTVPLKLRCLAR